jgi:phosphatidylcholine synthase
MADELQNQQQVPLHVNALPRFQSKGTIKTAQYTDTPWWLRGCAFVVHLYTASGAVLAFLIVLAAMRGNVVDALWLGIAALLIDGTDGWLARRLQVSKTLPWFDGRRLDDIVDYLTYVFAPILLLWSGGYLPIGPSGLILAGMPLLASCYQFCRVDAKTADDFFLGFPSYWNVVAFYTVVFKLAPTTVGTILLICSLLAFVPIRYVYPSRTKIFRQLTLALTALWLLMYGLILWQMPRPNPLLLYSSLFYPCYYVGLSLYLTYQAHSIQRKQT